MELNLDQPEIIIAIVALIAFLLVVIIVMAAFCTIGTYNRTTEIKKIIEDYLKTKNYGGRGRVCLKIVGNDA